MYMQVDYVVLVYTWQVYIWFVFKLVAVNWKNAFHSALNLSKLHFRIHVFGPIKSAPRFIMTFKLNLMEVHVRYNAMQCCYMYIY